METLDANRFKQIFSRIKDVMVDQKEELISLDGVMGDGDLGLTMVAAFTGAVKDISAYEEGDPGQLCIKAGMAMSKAAPSTMGTLLATGFMRGGKAVRNKTELGPADISVFFSAFVEGIMERGKSKAGEKTIIDSLYPAAMVLKERVDQKANLPEALSSALAAAQAGLEHTKGMVAQHGRAAYYQEKSLGKQDPGATVGMLIVKAFADYVHSS